MAERAPKYGPGNIWPKHMARLPDGSVVPPADRPARATGVAGIWPKHMARLPDGSVVPPVDRPSRPTGAASIVSRRRRDHATMLLEDHAGGRLGRFGTTAELGVGAWLGGTLEGRTDGASIGPIPVNLGVGIVLLATSHLKSKLSSDLHNLGNGFIGSWAAAAGFAFGKRWKESGGHPWAVPPAGPPHGP